MQTFQYQETDLIGVHTSDFVGSKNADNSATTSRFVLFSLNSELK